ncbi:MAG: beta-galactosidase, partial [Armatimonadetes bacterium]|nr:beta-galactosidase [Armatimonadota bacterium]
VMPHHGAPTLFIDERPVPAMAYAAYGPSSEIFADFAAAGVRLFSVMGTPTSHGYNLAVDTWLAPGQYDYSQLDARFRMVLDECPDAWLFPRLYVSAPPWWLAQHPEAVVLYDPGDGRPVPFTQNGRQVPSWSSPAWRAATVEALQELVAHVEAQPYADRVVGYHIASGTTEEWMMWGANDNLWTDYSPDNTAAFRRWLSTRYQTDAALRAAWGDPAVTLATATVPSRKARETSAAGVLRDPATDTPSIDYARYISAMTAETIDLLCGAVKQATGGQRLAGVFYGYLLQLFGQRQQNAAHLALDAVLRSPHVDFLCSPTSYAFRALGSGVSHFMAPLGSVLAHGKLWLDENDIRTSLSPGKLGEWGRQADVAGDIRQQDRELANVLVHGVGQWWFDVGQNRYNDPQLMAHLGKLSAVAARTLEFDRSPADDVALVVDGRGLANINVGDPLMSPLMLHQMAAMARLGAAVGHYDLTDLERLARHRLVVFAGLYDPSAAQRAALERLKGEGRVLVFTHAPGPYDDGRWTPGAMSALAGLGLKIEDRALNARVTLAADPLTAGLDPAYGVEQPTRPVVVG